MPDHDHKPPIRSLSGWSWSGGPECEGNWKGEREVERVLRRAQDKNIVRDFGVGSCSVWFDAAAGPETRAVRDEVDALVPADWKRGN
jgi:hypothetical protein